MFKSSRNGYMLNNNKKIKGYDWWWHSLVAENQSTGVLEPFFIEYYILNPGFGSDKPIFGDTPSYAMIKAGKWGENRSQIDNFWGIDSVKASKKELDVSFDNNIVTDRRMIGSVSLTPEESNDHPEYMSDPGSMSWDLKIKKELKFSVGYGASKLFRKSGLFSMFWHVEGMKTRYDGEIIYNNQLYRVRPETSYGYQDKNWGKDYTNPWIWLNCNCFRDENEKILENTSLDVGGGNPQLAGFSLGEKILVKFIHEFKEYEFNFTHLFFQKQKWSCNEDETHIHWNILVTNRKNILKVNFKCAKDTMIKVNYENPNGVQNHKNLWNGGYANGTLELLSKKTKSRICLLEGSLGGCEYGRY